MVPSADLKDHGVSCIRIVIADEEAAFCADLREVLTSHHGIEIVGEAHDPDRAVVLIAAFAPDVLLFDYALCRQLRVRETGYPEICPVTPPKIVMLKAPESAKIIDSLRLGAQGIVLKGSARPIWRMSIAAVAAGRYWLGSESLAVLIQAIRESSPHSVRTKPARHFSLTPREIEIVQKIADGRSNKEVGRDFSIRERTVKHHLTNIFGKVGVSSRLELALFARDHRIFPASSDAPSPENAPRPEHQESKE